MRLRIVTVAVAATLAVAGLAGCQTHVGTAATIDGHRVTESNVNDYVTQKAQPVTLQNADGSATSASPKSFVVQELIVGGLLSKVIARLPHAPSPAKIDSELDHERNGQTYTQQAEKLGLKGYTEGFYKIVMRNQLLQRGLQEAQQAGVNLTSVIGKLHFPVTVNPRYGSWDAKHFSFDGKPAVPSYLTRQPAPNAGATSAPVG